MQTQYRENESIRAENSPSRTWYPYPSDPVNRWWMGTFHQGCLQEMGLPLPLSMDNPTVQPTDSSDTRLGSLSYNQESYAAWPKIILPCPCQSHQPRGAPPGLHPPGGMPVLTGILMTVYNLTLLSTLPHQLVSLWALYHIVCILFIYICGRRI